MKSIVLLSVVVLLLSCTQTHQHPVKQDQKESLRTSETAEPKKTSFNAPATLKNTSWNSQFYHYNNFYCFTSDSTGYSEDGQYAWSTPIDLKKNKIKENQILYADKQSFRYTIKAGKLTLEYVKNINGDIPKSRSFLYSDSTQQWISEYEYTYGKEVLNAGKREEIEHSVPMIK